MNRLPSRALTILHRSEPALAAGRLRCYSRIMSRPTVLLILLTAAAAQAAPRGPVLHLVSVGVARHFDRRQDLRYAHRDAAVFAAALTERSLGRYEDIRIDLLTNQAATAPKVLAALEGVAARARPEDTVAFFLSGHGGVDSKLGFVFVTYESRINDPGGTCLRWRDAAAVLARVRAARVLLFVDACEAGGALQSSSRLGDLLACDAPRNLAVFASSSATTNSIELGPRSHGAYTAALLDALHGGADVAPADGLITLDELDRYLAERVVRLTKGEQIPHPLKAAAVDRGLVVCRAQPPDPR